MANTFSRKLARSVGTTANQVGSFSATTSTVVIGLSVCNTTGGAITANVYLNASAANTYLVANAPISSGASLAVVGGDQKVVLQSGDSIYVQSSAATSVDCIMSIMEIT